MLTTRISPKKQITIPTALFDELGLEIGDHLEVNIEREKLIFTPKKLISKDQLWFWSNGWQNKEKEAGKNIREKKITGPFSSGKALVKSLKSRKS
ncbi:MAG: AbrB/MazE/SpoVT family DNA-binding domain-containing protein [bacterium]